MNSLNATPTAPHVRPQSSTRKGMSLVVLRGLVILFGLLVYAILATDVITNLQGLAAYTLLLLWYLYAEVKNLWVRDTYLFWINPVVLASIFTFVLTFGVSNVLFFMPEDEVALVGVQPNVTFWMNQLMLLVLLGAVSMWVGYSSGIGLGMGRMLQRSREMRKWMKISGRINMPVVYFCLVTSLIARLLAIKLGVYGYSSSYDQLIAAASYTEYLSMAGLLGKLALLCVALQCFDLSRTVHLDVQRLWLVLGIEVVFGFLSGFKSAVVMPFVIVGIVYYTQRNRFPLWLIPSVVIAIMVAYAVIEPFRVARNENAGFVGTSIGSIVSTITSAGSLNANDDGERASTAVNFLARSNLTYVASLGIEYAANNELPAGSPDFVGDIILAPAYAFIPRFLWEGKSLQNSGLWYTNQIMGFDIMSSTAYSPFTYLNFSGGPLAVILGFLTVGIIQRGLFDGLRRFGGGGLIVLLGLLGSLTNIDSAFSSFFVGILRFLPIMVVLQYALLKRLRR
ncbi:MAG: hypothetical protein Q8L68_02500 [Methylococcales bacterium]|nr:hypothetical protein [Methylococcales bacterium]